MLNHHSTDWQSNINKVCHNINDISYFGNNDRKCSLSQCYWHTCNNILKKIAWYPLISVSRSSKTLKEYEIWNNQWYIRLDVVTGSQKWSKNVIRFSRGCNTIFNPSYSQDSQWGGREIELLLALLKKRSRDFCGQM